MIEPQRESIRERVGRVFVNVLRRTGRDLDAKIDKTPSKDPIGETRTILTKMDSIRNAGDQYVLAERLEIVSRQYGDKL